MNYGRHVLAAAFILLGCLQTAEAQEKIRIAIWEVENNSEGRWWFSGDLGPAARNHIDTEFGENATLASKFSVVERSKLDLVLKEQGLSASGAVDPKTAAKVGSMLGVRYIVVGGIDKFSISNTQGRLGAFGVGGNLQQAAAAINLRFVDTTTAERVLAVSAESDVKKGGGMFKGTSLSRDAEWGLASEAIQKASKAVVAKFVSGGYLERLATVAAPSSKLEAKVVKIDGNRMWINVGSASGVAVGDTFGVFTGEALVDPDTGASLGMDAKQTGSGTVTEVHEKFSILTFTGTAEAKNTFLRKQP